MSTAVPLVQALSSVCRPAPVFFDKGEQVLVRARVEQFMLEDTHVNIVVGNSRGSSAFWVPTSELSRPDPHINALRRQITDLTRRVVVAAIEAEKIADPSVRIALKTALAGDI